jgi:F0F1-type ATP synthase assembly protein I
VANQRSAVGIQDLLAIGAICGVSIGIGVFAGYLLDRAAGTSPLLTFLGLALGILGAGIGARAVIRPYLRASASAVAHPPKIDRHATDPHATDTVTKTKD